MQNYNLYLREAGITNRDMIAELKKYYPRYGKAVQSMVCHPERYGVRLTAPAEGVLVEKFGDFAGLSDAWTFVNAEDMPRIRKREQRRKGNRLTVRLDDGLFAQWEEFYKKTTFASTQDMLEAAIMEFLQRRGV